MKFAMAGLLLTAAAQALPSSVDISTIAEFSEGEFLESVILDGSDIVVSSLQTGRIYRVDRGSGAVRIWATIPVGRAGSLREGLFCLAADGKGGVFVNVYSPDPLKHGVWHVDSKGTAQMVVKLPSDVVPNGLARADDGTLYIADSGRGAVWRVRPGSMPDLWSDHDLLKAGGADPQIPAANGIKLFREAVFVTVSDTRRLVRIPILSSGRAGQPILEAEGIGGDDFAIDPQGNLYVTTHPRNSLIKVDRRGNFVVLADHASGLLGPTAAAWDPHDADTKALYVVTDGGAFAPPPSGPEPARLLRVVLAPD